MNRVHRLVAEVTNKANIMFQNAKALHAMAMAKSLPGFG